MDTLPPRQISVLEPVGAAIEKTKEILFQPFDLGKWFILGFCAWLATLGDGGGGGGGNFNFGNRTGGSGPNFQHELHNLKEGILNNLPVIMTVGIVVVLIVLVLTFLFMWLKSRGQFMFLHGVAQNVGEVVNPWSRYARQANSLFLFKIVLWLIGSVVALVFIVPLIFIFISFMETDFKVFAVAAIIPAIFLVIGFICFCIALTVLKVLTKDFVVPIMYLQDCTVTEGWKRFWSLARYHKGSFVLFLLCLFVVNIVLGMIAFAVVLAACCLCCVGIIFMIPYIRTVAMLPLLVWRRAYSALFLAQFGPEFDVFPKATPVVVPSASIPPVGPITPTPPDQNF
ncbi:MAG: hypothetical protein ISS71_04050 [Phycisphaerae bacterium]|nr:hypothetical protein [Phycisphaerae bacterium]